jgi:predicted nucleic acid-binding protein
MFLDTSGLLCFHHPAEPQHAEAVLRQRPDKQWSLCDAISFLLMSQHGIQDALTTDHHFEQAGFVRLLKP